MQLVGPRRCCIVEQDLLWSTLNPISSILLQQALVRGYLTGELWTRILVESAVEFGRCNAGDWHGRL